jgi:hypothetical protein
MIAAATLTGTDFSPGITQKKIKLSVQWHRLAQIFPALPGVAMPVFSAHKSSFSLVLEA